MTNTLKEKFLSDAVEAKSVADFLERYYKADRFHSQSDPEKAKRILADYEAEFKADGYCIISKWESVTGKVVAYFGEQGEDEVEFARRIA
jgi:hypothetical protein